MLVTPDAVDALAHAKAGRADVVLLHMPIDAMCDMDLPNVMHTVSEGAYLPVVVLADSPAERERCFYLESGADEVICGDVSDRELIARLAGMLRIKQLHDELTASRSALWEALRRERSLMASVRQDNLRLRALCNTDPLTRLQNVAAFHNILRHEFRIARRYSQPLSLLMLDMDFFKRVNDNHGHPVGDHVLKELAVILRQSVRDSDVVSRTGGEEFSILLPRADRRKAMLFGRRIRRKVADTPFAAPGGEIRLTVSLGLASYPADAQITEPGMLLFFADQALLAAKRAGRDRVMAFVDLSAREKHHLWRQYQQCPPELSAPVVQPDEAAGLDVGSPPSEAPDAAAADAGSAKS